MQHVIAIVSGGASGLGAATSSYLVRHGARVIVVDLPNAHDRFLKLKEEIMNMHTDDNNHIMAGSLEFAAANVTNEDEISSALDKAAELFGEQGELYHFFFSLPFCKLDSSPFTSDFQPLGYIHCAYFRFSQCRSQLRWNCTSEEDPIRKNQRERNCYPSCSFTRRVCKNNDCQRCRIIQSRAFIGRSYGQ